MHQGQGLAMGQERIQRKMAMSYQACVAAWANRAKTAPNREISHLESKTENNINNIILKNNLNNINNISQKEDYKGLYRLIHTDPDFKLAQAWGMFPAYLYKTCKENGLQAVRKAIQTTAAYHDSYFKKNEPLTQQRGKLCRKILIESLKH